MKRFLTLFAAAATLFNCSHDEAFTPNTPTEKATYYASFADAEGDSRTYLDDEFKLLWHNDDRISLFTTTYNEEYKFADPTGSNAGKFEAIDNDSWVTGNPISTTYAVYPYNEDNALSNSEVLTIYFPAEQAYAEKSFGRGANTMVAAAQSSTNRLLPFRNAGGYLMLKLYGEGAVKSITLEGNNDEILSGAATAQAKYGYLPLITMGNEGGKTITLTCEEAVELGATEAEATVFWLVVPPITFEEGFTITVTDDNGGTYTKSTSKELVIERNEIKSMSALNPTFEGETEDPEVTENMRIRYVASAKVTPNVTSSSAFGANIISNEWDEATGKGVITFDGEVTKINASAFKQCSELTEITFPSSLESIEEGAFYGCKIQNYEGKFVTEDGFVIVDNTLIAMEYSETRTSLTIPSNVTIIGSLLCRGCSELELLTLHDKITTINDYAFYECSGIKRLNIPNSVTHIGKSAFTYCNGLQQTSIGSGLQTAGFKPFGGCTGKVYINYNPGISADGYMGHAEFSSSNFDEIVLSENVTEIRDYAFSQMREVPAIYCLPTTPPTLSTNSYIRNAPAIYVPASDDDSIINAYKQAEGWWEVRDKIFEIEEAEDNEVISIPNNQIWYKSIDNKIRIPYTTTGFGATYKSNEYNDENEYWIISFDGDVTTIPSSAFLNNNGSFGVTEVILPSSLTTIKRNAFSYCLELSSVYIPKNVTTIEDFAFIRCSGIEAFYGKYASSDNRCLIKDGAIISFATSGIEQYITPSEANTIARYGFYGATIKVLTITENITEIGIDAFSASRLESINLPSSITSIPSNAFGNSYYLKSCNIPVGITTIGSYAFQSCYALQTLSLPSTVTTIGNNAFKNAKIETLHILCNIPDGSVYGTEAYFYSANIGHAIIGEQVSSIGQLAFANSKVQKLTLGKDITSIGKYALSECKNLTEIYCKAVTPPLAEDSFSNLASINKIYVPASDDDSIINTYKTADGWIDYADYIYEYEFTE